MSAITIPEGVFPPPGVAFKTEAQRDLAVAMHNAGILRLQYCSHGKWYSDVKSNTRKPQDYRITPQKRRTVGPFESVHEGSTYNTSTETAWARAMNEACAAGIKRVRIKCTATAEEIL